MTLYKTCTAAAIVVATALPAFAQHHGGGVSRASVRAGVRVVPRSIVRGRIAPAALRVYGAPFRALPARAYVFRPRVNIGVGLVGGYPLAYPYRASAYSYSYGVARIAPLAFAAPLAYGADAGGISFAITPYDAQLLIDGQAIGIVGRFSPGSDPLIVAPGRHRVEIRAPGFRPAVFEADVAPDIVIPYFGTLQR